ncbi:MAG TPA: hypothetical protein VHV54_05175, partial [Candidatus Binatia bacterium]|nr:hypothetical protein [Candidatus Binatia bacterium]
MAWARRTQIYHLAADDTCRPILLVGAAAENSLCHASDIHPSFVEGLFFFCCFSAVGHNCINARDQNHRLQGQSETGER